MAGEAPLLLLRKLEVAYGGIHAVKGIDLDVGQGELVCLSARTAPARRRR